MSEQPVTILYDVHGNLVALEAVLVEAEREGLTTFLLGGDYASFGPWPRAKYFVDTLAHCAAPLRFRDEASAETAAPMLACVIRH